MSEREEHYSAWKKAVIKSFEYSPISESNIKTKYYISSTTITWMTLTSFCGVLLYMFIRKH